MRVFMLGGYGKVGLPTAKMLAKYDLVSEIVIAGRSGDKADLAAREIGEKAIAVQLDGSEPVQLTAAAAGYDIIVNAVSNQIALPALHAAIQVGAHYCDVGFGLDFITQMQEYQSEVQEAGATAVICTGVSPCLTNLMGVHAASQLDIIEQLQSGRSWVFQNALTLTPQQWFGDPWVSLEALRRYKGFLNWMLQVAVEAESQLWRDSRDGKWVSYDPLEDGLVVPLSGGDSIIAYPYHSHYPIFDILPVDLAIEQPVEVWFTPFPPQLHDLFRDHVASVARGKTDLAAALASFYQTVENNPSSWLTVDDDFAIYTPDWVSSVGVKNGRAARYMCWFRHEIWSERSAWLLTSAPLAVAVLKVLRGEVPGKGVIYAEKAFDPIPFIDEVASIYPEPLPDGKLIDESFDWLE